MKIKFTRKRAFNERLTFDAKALSELVRQLKAAGFCDFEIKVPTEYKKQFRKDIFDVEEFLQLGYNFVAQILTASSQGEVIKILFVNHGKAISSLSDTTFPSSHSVTPSFFLETQDPVRLIGLEDFVRTLLEKNSVRSLGVARIQQIFFAAGSLYFLLLASILYGSLQSHDLSIFSAYPLWIFGILCVAILYFFYYIIHPGGLYTAPFEHPLVSFYRRISAGDLRNNLLIVAIVWILKILIGGIILGVTVNIISDLLKQPVIDVLRSWVN